MKQIKLLILPVLIILMSACTAEYNITIAEDGIKEEIIAYYDNNKANKKIVNQLYKQKAAAYYDMDKNITNYYHIKKYGNKTSSKLALKYDYEYENHTKLQNSNVLKQCFYNVSVVKDKKFLTLNTSEGVDCFSHDGQEMIDKVDVSITTNYKVAESNADKVLNNKYIWTITDNNSDSKSIYMKIDYTDKKQQQKVNNQIYIYLLIFVIISPVLLILVRSYRNKKYGYKK